MATELYWRPVMNTENWRDPWTTPEFQANQRNFPAEKLLQYKGQHIAWSWDGAEIVAAAPDSESLDKKLCEAGIDPLKVIYDFVEDPDLSYLR
jgi:hypothetical protein